MRDADGHEQVIVAIKTLGARPRPLLGSRKRSRKANDRDGGPEAVAIVRVTVIAAQPFESETAARDWLAQLRGRDAQATELVGALRAVNRIVQAHRLATQDGYELELSERAAHRIRIGYGSGAQVAEGNWTDARALSPEGTAKRRRVQLDPEPVVADLLSARRKPEPADDLLLRARLDFDQGRMRQAVLQLAAALRAWPADDAAGQRERAEKLEPKAIQGEPLNEAAQTELAQLLTECERASRRRLHDR